MKHALTCGPAWAASLLLSLLASAGVAPAAELTAGPLIGHTTDRTALVWAQAEGEGDLRVRFRPAGAEGAEWREAGPAAFDPELYGVAVVPLEGLEASTAYEYQLLVDGQPQPDAWTFRTLPPPGRGKVRIAFGSCVHLGRFPEQWLFGTIAEARPDAFLFIGDNCYYSEEDCEDPALMERRMHRQRATPYLTPLVATTPTLAIWDDHDYGPNNSDRTFPLKEASRRIFQAYWPNPSFGEDGQGIYSRAVLGPVELFLLDDRTFRDPNRTPDTPEKTILGERQRDWLIEALASSQSPIKLVALGGQFLASYHPFESHQTATHERKLIVDAIRERGVEGVVFISGDRHLAEAIRWPAETTGLSYDLWDLTSSPLANRWFAQGAAAPNPEREFIYCDGLNAGWVEVDAETKTVRLALTDAAGETVWSVEPDLFPR